ncbi:MAG: iron-sulfur cluster repair di-iron protein [Pirellulales bacterium]
MTEFHAEQTVGSIVAARPALSRVFEIYGIDYCCGGKKALRLACAEKALDEGAILAELARQESNADETGFVDAASMSLTELADHIEQTHHAYLRAEFPRLLRMTERVASVHGDKDERLAAIRDTVKALVNELSSHLMKEELVLFPIVRRLDASDVPVVSHCGSIGNPIRQMEHEHQDAGGALGQLRSLSDDFTPPEWACNTYRAMLDALAHFEHDMHQHIHKEDNVLFPRALERESELARQQFATQGGSR